MKLLLVEDERPMATFIKKGLSEEGFAVDAVETAPEADEAIHVNDYDVVVLDVMIPGGDGFDLCYKWRQESIATPILFVTARDSVADRVTGLNGGGDDYLVKPFAFDELVARVRALMRRRQESPHSNIIVAGDITIDVAKRSVERNGRMIHLTNREFQLLEYLARNSGRVVGRMAIWEHVWETGMEPDSNVVDVYVRYLRTKLGRKPDAIETIRGTGYRLVA